MKLNKTIMYWVVFLIVVPLIYAALGTTWVLRTSDGDITINTSIISGTTLSYTNLTKCADNQILKIDGATWNCEADATGAGADPDKWVLANFSGAYEDVNLTCIEITGGAGLCDGVDATGTFDNGTNINVSLAYVNMLTIYNSLTCTDCILPSALHLMYFSLSDFVDDIGVQTEASAWKYLNFTAALNDYDNLTYDMELDNATILRVGNISNIKSRVDTNASTACSAGEYLDGDGLCYDVNDTIDAKLVTTYFTASQIAVVTGTGQGVIADLQGYNEVSFNVSEVDSDFELRINFTGVTGINQLIYRYKTEPGDPHIMHTQVWDYVAGDWEEYAEEGSREHFGIFTYMVFDEAKHLSGGIVQVRFYTTNGLPNTVHKWQFDWVTISDGLATPSSSESDPFSVRKDGSTPLTDSWDAGTAYTIRIGQINATWNGSYLYTTVADAYNFGNNLSSDLTKLGNTNINTSGSLNVSGDGYFGGNVGIGTTNPNAPLEVEGVYPVDTVGGFASGILHVKTSDNSEFSNSVITGHNSFNTNTQLWYFGSTSGSNYDIAFINRQNGSLSLWTNSTKRMTISNTGNVGIGTTSPVEDLTVVGNFSTTKTNNSMGSFTMGLYNSTCSGFRFSNTGGWILSCEP